MSQNQTRSKTVLLVLLAFIAAMGIVVRMFVKITLMPDLDLTPGFMFSELGGVLGGVIGGILVGAIVGIGGAMAGSEAPLLPLIGNVCLGIGTGVAVFIDKNRSSTKYYITAVVGGAVIGGFLPTLFISILILMVPLEGAVFAAIIDMLQAALWAIVALIVYRTIIVPVVGTYLSADKSADSN